MIKRSSDVTYGEVFCSPTYRYASWTGCILQVFDQLTGILVIIFYSNLLFRGLEVSPASITALIGVVNFVAAIISIFLLMCLGRKTLILYFNGCMSVDLLLLSYFSFQKNTIGMIVCVLLFIVFFQFSMGTVNWIYIAETMHEKALGVAVSIIWFGSLAISISVPLLL